jgi:hypothetical protein
MLVITMTLLGGASYLALASIDRASALVDGSAARQGRDIGTLLLTVGLQSNASGSYIWVLDYGWQSSPIRSVFLNAGSVAWSSDCPADWSGSICRVILPQGARGLVTIVVGGKSLEVSV